MPRYLTNIQKDENLFNKVSLAAQRSNRDIRLLTGPMPYCGTMDDDGYN